MFKLVFSILLCTTNTIGLSSNELTVVLLSQSNSFYSNLTKTIKQNLINQSTINKSPQIIIEETNFSKSKGTWTIIGILNKLKNILRKQTKWILFCDDRCKIDLNKLMKNLEKEKQEFLGFPLYDHEATIIHHFADHDNPKSFLYPNLSSGIIISKKLFLILQKRELPDNDFFIDASHEFSKFIQNDYENGVRLQSVPYLCSYYTENKTDCAIYDNGYPNCDHNVLLDKIIFSVKTFTKFHEDRLKFVTSTWGKYVKHIRYFSDYEDENIPTIDIGVPNTINGHCEKSFKILDHVLEEIKTNKSLSYVNWIVLSDDDTILSPSRLSKFLGCFKNEAELCLGERYGFNILNDNGYNYITGGGGIIFKLSTAQKIIANCRCPKINSPDDMIIGACLKKLGINLTHSPLFHQARPNDYSPDVILISNTISFHKFWLINPYDVFSRWFEIEDRINFEKNINTNDNNLIEEQYFNDEL